MCTHAGSSGPHLVRPGQVTAPPCSLLQPRSSPDHGAEDSVAWELRQGLLPDLTSLRKGRESRRGRVALPLGQESQSKRKESTGAGN